MKYYELSWSILNAYHKLLLYSTLLFNMAYIKFLVTTIKYNGILNAVVSCFAVNATRVPTTQPHNWNLLYKTFDDKWMDANWHEEIFLKTIFLIKLMQQTLPSFTWETNSKKNIDLYSPNHCQTHQKYSCLSGKTKLRKGRCLSPARKSCWTHQSSCQKKCGTKCTRATVYQTSANVMVQDVCSSL